MCRGFTALVDYWLLVQQKLDRMGLRRQENLKNQSHRMESNNFFSQPFDFLPDLFRHSMFRQIDLAGRN